MSAKRRISKSLQLSLVSVVLEFMVRAGLTEADLRSCFEKGVKKAFAEKGGMGVRSRNDRYLPKGDISADMMRVWHRESRYLDAVDAKPRPLYLTKGRNSLRAMAQRFDPKVDVHQLTDFLSSSGLIRRTSDGRYLPTTDGGAITKHDHFVAEHLAKSVMRLISTISRNTVEKSHQPLIERYAFVSDLNRSDADEFREFTKRQGLSYLQAVDDWLEQRRANRKPSGASRDKPSGVVAGVQIVAYLGDRLDAREKKMIGDSQRQGIEGSDAL